jgi:hypothetical protein
LKTKNILTEIAIAFALYWLFVGLISLFPQLKSGPLTFYLFLPAGAKLFSILIFRWRGAIGVGLGTFLRLTLADPAYPWSDWLLVALSTTLLLFLAIEASLRILKIDEDLSNLRYYQIVVLAVVASIANGTAFIHSLSWVTGKAMENGLFHNSFSTVLSNFAGNALFVCSLMLIMQHKGMILNFMMKRKGRVK